MKISIENFKSIRKLRNFELRPLTILSGINSSGKSSFIQLLLLMKQTVELSSAKQPFYLDGNLYNVREFKDIVFNHDIENNIEVSFLFDKEEVLRIQNPELSIFKNNNFTTAVIIKFAALSDSVFIKEFEVKIESSDDIKKPYINFRFNGKDYSIETNDNLFGKEIWDKVNTGSVNFLSFYPLYLQGSGNNTEDIVLKLNWVKKLVNPFFEKSSYIGPNRESPQEEYSAKRNLKTVNPTGNNVAQILENFADEQIQLFQITNQDDIIEYKLEKATLAAGVKYWMCDVFNVADDLQAKRIGENYQVVLVSKSKLSTNIKHVGFGISQLLPIVVEGLRMSLEGTLIIEQPEIHLHPKLQSLLFDFLYGLTLQGKKVIVETHSSHFITRMRRRIAEDESNEMDGRINLTFIENDIFRTIGLNDYGGLDYYPEDFIEQPNSELEAIVKAQMNKRLKKK